jgi:hypothetical protein
MSDILPDIAIVGLPASGKTTLLAAIWHSIRESHSATTLGFGGLNEGNYEHVNNLARRWRAGKRQLRTQTSGVKVVSMNLKDADVGSYEVSFPDVPGEDFSNMWEKRELDEAMKQTLIARAIVLVINGDTIKFPAWVAEQVAIAEATGLKKGQCEVVDWRADLAPTQVQLVALLQFLMSGVLNVGPRRLAVLISAWDEVEGEGLEPEAILALKLPLLHQYLQNGRDQWTWRVWGLSAQGGVYEDQDNGEYLPVTEALREIERPSERIKVVDGKIISSDITLPLAWLMR